MESLTFQPIFSSWLAAILLWGGIAVVSFFFLRSADRISRRKNSFLFGIRFFLLFLFGWILLRPGIERVAEEQLPASIAVLVDTSESMSITDMPNGDSRYRAALKTVEKISSIAGLRYPIPLSVYGFDESFRLIAEEGEESHFSEEPEGTETAVGAGLNGLLNQYAGKRLLGVLLLSDGAERSENGTVSPHDAALKYRDAGVPIYPLVYGEIEGAAARRDISLSDPAAPLRVFLGNEVVLSGQVRVTGFKGGKVPLVLYAEENGEMVQADQMEFAPNEDDQIFPYRMSYKTKNGGELKLTLSVPVQKGEILKENNEVNLYIPVEEGGLSVLFLEGRRRFEDKFIRMALDSTKEIQVEYRRYPADEKSPVADDLDLSPYSVLILGDADPASFGGNSAAALEKSLENGLGLICLAGEENIAEGRLRKTFLAKLLPIELPKSAAGGENLRQEGLFWISPADSRNDYLTQLSVDPVKSQKIWDSLPPLSGIIQGGAVKPQSRIVLQGRNNLGETFPVLITSGMGEGRVLLFLTDRTWEWGMSKHREEYQKFWRQIIFWASSADELQPGELILQKETSSCQSGDPFEFRVLYQPREETNREKIQVSAQVSAPDGSCQSIPLVQDGDQWKGIFNETKFSGEYLIQAAAEEGGERNVRTGRFAVKESHFELENPASNPGQMQSLAKLSGGRVIADQDIESLFDELAVKKGGIVNKVRTRYPLCSNGYFFGIFVLLFTVEWFLRKKWGMV